MPGYIGAIGLTDGPYLVSAAHNGDVDLEGSKLPSIAESDVAPIVAASRSVTLPDGDSVEIPVTILVTGYVLDESENVAHAGSLTADCGPALDFCVVAPYTVDLPEGMTWLPRHSPRGNSHATPAVTATLYATSQL